MSVGWLSYQHLEVRTQWTHSMKQENVAMVTKTKLLIIHVKSRQLTQKLNNSMQTKEFNGFIVHRVYTNLVNSNWYV